MEINFAKALQDAIACFCASSAVAGAVCENHIRQGFCKLLSLVFELEVPAQVPYVEITFLKCFLS